MAPIPVSAPSSAPTTAATSTTMAPRAPAATVPTALVLVVPSPALILVAPVSAASSSPAPSGAQLLTARGGHSGNPNRVGFFGFLRFRVSKNATQDLPNVKATQHFGYPINRVRVTPNNPLLSTPVRYNAHSTVSGGVVRCRELADRGCEEEQAAVINLVHDSLA
jgi:hypothetical protein